MSGTPIMVSQGMEVLQPREGKALPVPCNEWDNLRKQIGHLTTEPWLLQNSGSLLVGAAVATTISILTGAVMPSATTPNAIVIGWAVTAVCGLTGSVTLYFAHKERGVHQIKAAMIVTQMELIEQRFERGA
jgi:hypothetical protein